MIPGRAAATVKLASAGGLVAATMVAGLVLVLVAAISGQQNALQHQTSGCSSDSGGVNVVDAVATSGSLAQSVPPGGYSSDQIANARTIIAVGKRLGVPAYGWVVAIAAALQESRLHNLHGGDRDSLGLFQQRPSAGWGTPAQIESPAVAAMAFFGRSPYTHNTGLLQIPGWQNMQVTVAAQAVQRSGFPLAYAQHQAAAQTLVAQLAQGVDPASLTASNTCSAASSGALIDNTAFVGPLQPSALVARAHWLSQHGGNGWFERCQHFAAVLDGHASSGYATATIAMAHFKAQGTFHSDASARAPPIGAWLYFTDSTNPAGHVAVYLGHGLVASTDVFGEGRVGIGPFTAITSSTWHMQYQGWAAPWGAHAPASATEVALPPEGGDGTVAGTGARVTMIADQTEFHSPNSNFVAALRQDMRLAPDVITFGESAKRGPDLVRRVTGGSYTSYAGGTEAHERGGGIHSVDDQVMWRTATWSPIAEGRARTTNAELTHPGGLNARYAVYVVLQRKTDGARISVVATHQPVNVYRIRGAGTVANYAKGMDSLISVARQLAPYGPVFIGGDMNSHPGEAPMTAASKMASIGFGYTLSNIIHIFYPKSGGVTVARQRTLPVDALHEHGAEVTTFDLGGHGPITDFTPVSPVSGG